MATIDPDREYSDYLFAERFKDNKADPEWVEHLMKHRRGLDVVRARLLVLVCGRKAWEGFAPQPDYDEMKRKVEQQIGRLDKVYGEASHTGDAVLFKFQVRKEQQRLREEVVTLESQKVRSDDRRVMHNFILRAAAIYEDDNHTAYQKNIRDESKDRRMKEVSPFCQFLEYTLGIDGENDDEGRYLLALDVKSALRKPDRLEHDPVLEVIREIIAENQISEENI